MRVRVKVWIYMRVRVKVWGYQIGTS